MTRLLDAKGVATVADHQYQYNAASRITQIAEQANTKSFGYDVVDRLTPALYTNPLQPSENYSYDAVGNRTGSQLSASYNYQPFNRLTTTSSATYVYDNNGNPTSKTDSTGTTQFGWDFENRLKQVALPNGITVSYKYDAIGRRIQRIPTSGISTNFIYDGQDVLKDLNSDGSTVEYLNGPGVDNKLRLNDSRLAATGPLYFLQDHLGSTTTLTNSLGVSVSQLTYDAFGNSSGSSLTRYDYTGRERDPDTGLLYYRARWYDPQLGRFLSEDPSEFEGGLNEYVYTDNNPIYSVDPYGLQTVGPSRNPGNFPNVYPVCTVPKGGKGIEFLPDHEIINQRHHAQLEKGFKDMLENCECRQAFLDLGVDLGDVWNNGVLIGSATLIYDSAYSDAQIKLTGSERREARPFVNHDHAFTSTSDVDSRPHIFFNLTAHHEGLIRVLAHELLHAGGKKGQPPGDFWGKIGWDDLDYLGPKYRYLLKKCSGG